MHADELDRFPAGVTVQEATGLSGVSQQLITGQRTDHLDIRTKPECKLCCCSTMPRQLMEFNDS